MFKQTETPYIGAIIATVSGFTLNEWSAIFGILFGLITLLMNWYYKHKELKMKFDHLKKLLKGEIQNDEA